MQQLDNNAKNILLGFLLSDCILKDKRLIYTINKSFNYLLSATDYKRWKELIIKHLKVFKKNSADDTEDVNSCCKNILSYYY